MARDLYRMLSIKGMGRRRSGLIENIFLFISIELRRAESVEDET